jgi:hypothetical protein
MTVLMNYKRTVEDFKRCGSKSPTVYGLPYVSDCVGSNVDRWGGASMVKTLCRWFITVISFSLLYHCIQIDVLPGPQAARSVRRRHLPL